MFNPDVNVRQLTKSRNTRVSKACAHQSDDSDHDTDLTLET